MLADAACLPILPALARWDGNASTWRIDHALRFTVARSRRACISPARHEALIGGAPSPHWSNVQLHALGGLTGADFEVVDTSKLRP